MGLLDRVEEIEAHLASIEAGPAAQGAAARTLASLDPGEAVYLLDVLLARSATSPRSAQALDAAARALALSPEADLPRQQKERIRAIAEAAGKLEVCGLLQEKPAASGPAEIPLPSVSGLEGMTLGHKKMLARQADMDRMARLAAEGDARVIRELLLNPRLTEGLVVRIAARRPANREVLLEIWRSPRWSARLGVRRALAKNPFTPPEVASKILPHLLFHDLQEIARDSSIHQEVRALATKLASRRRPR